LKIIAIIPARYASVRFEGKALADIMGKTMIQRVYEQVSKARLISKVVVATDNDLIKTQAESFGAEVIMTSTKHNSGTERCAEVLQKIEESFDYIINVQGDEPFIQPEQIDTLAEMLDGKTQIATLMGRIKDLDTLSDTNVVKVVSGGGKALYFSRAAIPFLRGIPQNDRLKHHIFYKHVGIYAYRANTLSEITQLSPSVLELAESLEQLRWLANGYQIAIKETPYESMGIDTPQDLQKALEKYGSK
jgi:3-deoxy-manno-octulosonate cytidylyltransferase (CMP-KDO synthetase)